jgi:hypothetical protein
MCRESNPGTRLTLPVGWLRFVQVVEWLARVHHDLAPIALLPVGICRRAADFCGLDLVKSASADDCHIARGAASVPCTRRVRGETGILPLHKQYNHVTSASNARGNATTAHLA